MKSIEEIKKEFNQWTYVLQKMYTMPEVQRDPIDRLEAYLGLLGNFVLGQYPLDRETVEAMMVVLQSKQAAEREQGREYNAELTGIKLNACRYILGNNEQK